MDDIREVLRLLHGIKRKVDRLEDRIAKQEQKSTWVPAKVIISLTEWDNSQMLHARRNNLIEFKRKPTGRYLYNLNSLHPYFIKSAATLKRYDKLSAEEAAGIVAQHKFFK